MTTTTLSPPAAAAATRSTPRRVLAGRVVTGLLVAFLVVDSAGKVARGETSVEATLALGFADHHVALIGALLAIGVVLHLVPRTALLGAVYLTAYLGGAVAAHVRMDNIGSIVFTVAFAVALWVGYGLREPRLRQLAFGG